MTVPCEKTAGEKKKELNKEERKFRRKKLKKFVI